MKNIICFLLVCLVPAIAVHGAEQADTGKIETDFSLEQEDVGADEGESPDPGTGPASSLSIDGPMPIDTLSLEEGPGEEEAPAAERDPFEEPMEKLFATDYNQVIDMIQLRGIIKMGNSRQGLFLVGENSDGGQVDAETVLRRIGIDERIMVVVNGTQYNFTVVRFSSRAAVIVGENSEIYKVWL